MWIDVIHCDLYNSDWCFLHLRINKQTFLFFCLIIFYSGRRASLMQYWTQARSRSLVVFSFADNSWKFWRLHYLMHKIWHVSCLMIRYDIYIMSLYLSYLMISYWYDWIQILKLWDRSLGKVRLWTIRKDVLIYYY